MLIKKNNKSDLKESQLTSESIYKNRRLLLKALGLSALTIPITTTAQAGLFDIFSNKNNIDDADLNFQRSSLIHSKNSHYQSLKPMTPEEKILQYNNFYEFGTGKGDPASYSQQFKVDPWQLVIDGLVDKPLTLN